MGYFPRKSDYEEFMFNNLRRNFLAFPSFLEKERPSWLCLSWVEWQEPEFRVANFAERKSVKLQLESAI